MAHKRLIVCAYYEVPAPFSLPTYCFLGSYKYAAEDGGHANLSVYPSDIMDTYAGARHHGTALCKVKTLSFKGT